MYFGTNKKMKIIIKKTFKNNFNNGTLSLYDAHIMSPAVDIMYTYVCSLYGVY